MVRFVRTLQRRVTAQGRDFYALSIPPQVAEALGLKDGGQVAIEVKAVAKGKSEIVLIPLAQRHNHNSKKIGVMINNKKELGLMPLDLKFEPISTLEDLGIKPLPTLEELGIEPLDLDFDHRKPGKPKS